MPQQADDIQAVEKLCETRDWIVKELRKTIMGMEDVIDEMMIAIFAHGRCLLVGFPSLAKTMSLGFKRIEFTPASPPSPASCSPRRLPDPAAR